LTLFVCAELNDSTAMGGALALFSRVQGTHSEVFWFWAKAFVFDQPQGLGRALTEGIINSVQAKMAKVASYGVWVQHLKIWDGT
jgi:hypothetical protein